MVRADRQHIAGAAFPDAPAQVKAAIYLIAGDETRAARSDTAAERAVSTTVITAQLASPTRERRPTILFPLFPRLNRTRLSAWSSAVALSTDIAAAAATLSSERHL